MCRIVNSLPFSWNANSDDDDDDDANSAKHNLSLTEAR